MIVDFMGRISSVEFMARLDDYYENIRPYFHFLTFTEKKTLAQYTINCAAVSTRAISCTWSSPGHDYCLQTSSLMSEGYLQFRFKKIGFHFWTKAVLSVSASEGLKTKERTLCTFFSKRSYILFIHLSSQALRRHDHQQEPWWVSSNLDEGAC